MKKLEPCAPPQRPAHPRPDVDDLIFRDQTALVASDR